MTTKGLLERLSNGGALIVAEGYLLEFERRGYLKGGAFVPEVVLDHPELVRQLHEEFIHAGSDVVLAFTYYAHREQLRKVGRESDLEAMNSTALKLAREVADQHGALMAGNLCNTNVYDPEDKTTHATVENMFKEQVELAVSHNADYMVAETIHYYGEARIALDVIKLYGKGLPAVITLSVPPSGVLIDGVSTVDACKRLADAGAAVVGLNCGRGPATMLPLLKEIKKVCKGPVAALPVTFRTSEKEPTYHSLTVPGSGIPAFPNDLESCQCGTTEIGEFAKACKDIGIQYIGLCCGNSSNKLRIVAETYGRRPPASKFSPDLSQNFYLKKLKNTYSDNVEKFQS